MQAVGIQRGGDHLGDDGGRRSGATEIGEKAGMIPMRDRRNDLLIEVAEDGVEGLALIGARRRQSIDQLAGLGFRRDGIAARIGEIVGNPVDGVVGGAAEIGDVGGPVLLGIDGSSSAFRRLGGHEGSAKRRVYLTRSFLL